MTEMKELNKVPFLDAPVSSGSLFGPAVEGLADRFTEAQKSSQAMRHFHPKCTSSFAASSHPRLAPTKQTSKPTLATPEPRPKESRHDRERSRSAQRYPLPRRQDSLGYNASEVLLISQAEKGGARVSLPPDHPASSL